MIRKLLYSLACVSVLLGTTATAQIVTPNEALNRTPTADREFRAAWIATVANINWPSKPGLPVAQQQAEAIAQLDYLKQNHFNAAIFQVRPQADALYKSDIEPWSYFLTGKQGKAPEPFYDPLQFWVEAAHDRGIELHVWLNPYRAYHIAGDSISEKSIVKTNPELVVKLKEGYYWMDPALKGTQDRTTAVVMDLVKRYDIDGVHFDDYFYPYPSYNLNEDFPDSSSWNAYEKSGGKMTRPDWRRDNVNKLIERVYKSIKKEKPYVKFGLSPFGIWRPGYPASIEGFDQFDELYADAKLWLNKGWMDYFAPQLYWPISRVPLSFPVLLGWWQSENTLQRHLWPGIAVGTDTAVKTVNETINQVMISRGMLPQSSGTIHWSISSDIKNGNLSKALLAGPYKRQALIPASPGLDKKIPQSPIESIKVEADSLIIYWEPRDEKEAFKFVVYYKFNLENWSYQIFDRNERHFKIAKKINGLPVAMQIAVTTISRTGNESKWEKSNVSSKFQTEF